MKLTVFFFFFFAVCLFAYHALRWPCGAWGAARWDTGGAQPPCPGTCWASLVSAPRKAHSQQSGKRRSSAVVQNQLCLHALWKQCFGLRYLLREAGARGSVRVAEGRPLVHGRGHFESLPEEAVELRLRQHATGVRHLRKNICTHMRLSPLTLVNSDFDQNRHVADAAVDNSLASCQKLISGMRCWESKKKRGPRAKFDSVVVISLLENMGWCWQFGRQAAQAWHFWRDTSWNSGCGWKIVSRRLNPHQALLK